MSTLTESSSTSSPHPLSNDLAEAERAFRYYAQFHDITPSLEDVETARNLIRLEYQNTVPPDTTTSLHPRVRNIDIKPHVYQENGSLHVSENISLTRGNAIDLTRYESLDDIDSLVETVTTTSNLDTSDLIHQLRNAEDKAGIAFTYIRGRNAHLELLTKPHPVDPRQRLSKHTGRLLDADGGSIGESPLNEPCNSLSTNALTWMIANEVEECTLRNLEKELINLRQYTATCAPASSLNRS